MQQSLEKKKNIREWTRGKGIISLAPRVTSSTAA
jgi:hypothetical protein